MPTGIRRTLEFEARVQRDLERLQMAKAVKFNTTMVVDETTIVIGTKLGDGDICELWNVTYDTPAGVHEVGGSRFDKILEDDDGSSTRGVLKHAADPGDEDLVENEAKILTQLYPKTAKDEKFYRYLPRPLATFQASAGPRLMQMVLLPFLENYNSIAEVLAAFPDGIDWQDATWMFNRLLEGLGFMHKQNVAHGAILPPHVMIHAAGHGAKLIDFSYATAFDDRSEARVRAMVKAYQDYYPPEVLRRERVSGATDVFMAAKVFTALVGGDVKTGAMPDRVPPTVRAFIGECMHESRTMRPANAWDARDTWEEIVLAIVGKRRFRKFEMPKGA